MKRRKLFLDQTQSPRDKMQFPISQATILSRLITGIRLRSSEMGWADMVILTQVRAIKMTKEGLAITDAGKRRFIKFVKTNPNIVNLETKKL